MATLVAKRAVGQWIETLFSQRGERATVSRGDFLETITHNPSTGIYATGGDWVHAIEVCGASRLLFISGTMGLRPDFSAPPTLEEQLTCVWDNLRTILASAGMTTDNLVRLTSYLRDASYADANAAARLAALGSHRIPTTAIVVQTLSEDWLIELEAIAAG
ncbi:MAG: RidA family protein [Sphingomonas sp.]